MSLVEIRVELAKPMVVGSKSTLFTEPPRAEIFNSENMRAEKWAGAATTLRPSLVSGSSNVALY